jgi:phosphatidate cytidylyltransferase
MLKTRVITALCLLAGFALAVFFLPPLAWAWLIALLAAIAGWEWGGFMQLGKVGKLLLGVAVSLICGGCVLLFPAALGGDGWSEAAAWQLGRWVYLPALVFWIAVLPLWLARRWPLPGLAGGLLVGALILFPTLLALVQLRQLGPWTLICTLAIVWAADIAAYFAGRAFGKRKLAPSISPGKTWAGAVGAVFGVLAYGFAAAPWLPSALQPDLVLYAFTLVALTVLSIVGDLFESLLKRQAGIKDSSDILPGHGGILDRIDSLTSTLPFVCCAWLLSAL